MIYEEHALHRKHCDENRGELPHARHWGSSAGCEVQSPLVNPFQVQISATLRSLQFIEFMDSFESVMDVAKMLLMAVTFLLQNPFYGIPGFGNVDPIWIPT